MTAILLLAALLQSPDFDLNGNGDVPDFTLNGGDVPLVLRPKLDVPTRAPYVFGYTKARCPPCETLKADAPRLNSPRIELKEPPDWTAGHSFPVLHWETPTGWRSQDGWYGAGPFLTAYDKSMQEPPKAPIVQQESRPVLKHSGLYYGRYASTYDWPGDLRQHLTQSPHNYSWDYVNSLSDQAVISLHDSWHIQHANDRSAARQRRGFGFFNVK